MCYIERRVIFSYGIRHDEDVIMMTQFKDPVRPLKSTLSLKSYYFTAGSPSVKTVADRHRTDVAYYNKH